MKSKTKRELISGAIVLSWMVTAVISFALFLALHDKKAAKEKASIAETKLEENIRASQYTEVEASVKKRYDWDWLVEQDNIDSFQEYLSILPTSEQKKWLNKRIVDLEVEEISKGDYGDIPQAQARSYGGSTAHITITNDTGYVLTVWYSGESSKKTMISQLNT